MPFTPETLRFLRGLARNNRKTWFEARRAEYEAVVKAPIRELIEEMDVRLARFAPEIVGDPRRSMFRIYRDIRFSKDKSPYKTHAACWLYHRDGSHAVGSEATGAAPDSIFRSHRAGLSWVAGCGCPRAMRSTSSARRSRRTHVGSGQS